MKKKVVCLNDYASAQNHCLNHYKWLEDKYDVEVSTYDVSDDKSFDDFLVSFRLMEEKGPDAFPNNPKLNDAIKDADIVLSLMTPIPTKAIRDAKHLEAICLLRSGVENVNVPEASASGVRVVNVPGRLAVPVSEFTVGLMISEMKNIARAHKRIMDGGFGGSYVNKDYSFNIKGKTIGLVGLGMVGERVAKIINAMEGNVIAFDPYVSEEKAKKQNVRLVSLEELCRESDVVSVHYRLTPETENLIGEKEIGMMKPTCYIINTARAGLIDEDALVKALQEKRIGGAGLDVYRVEPLPEDHPLRKLDNVTLTPHFAGGCSDIMDITMGIMDKTLEKYFDDGKWMCVVNAKAFEGKEPK